MWDAKCEDLKHQIEILEDLIIKGLTNIDYSAPGANKRLSELKQELKSLEVRAHHQA